MRLALFLPLLLAACVSLPSPMERHAHADALAAARGWQAQRLAAGSFDLVAYVPRAVKADEMLTVYIEGDGFAWVTGSQPSLDPTPRDPLALRLALAQPTGNAAYLGRACQYVDAARSGCPQRYWTDARFAPETVEASGRALDVLKKRFGASRLELVGYSGGGNIAALLAERRQDVARLITVAGNLDHRAWTAALRITPLKGSLNAADNAARLQALPQTHFVGANDKVIAPEQARRWPSGFVGRTGANLRVLPGVDHHCCWVEHWPDLLDTARAGD